MLIVNSKGLLLTQIAAVNHSVFESGAQSLSRNKQESFFKNDLLNHISCSTDERAAKKKKNNKRNVKGSQPSSVYFLQFMYLVLFIVLCYSCQFCNLVGRDSFEAPLHQFHMHFVLLSYFPILLNDWKSKHLVGLRGKLGLICFHLLRFAPLQYSLGAVFSRNSGFQGYWD